MFSLAGKKALVTGATGGIGRAIAIALHQAGAIVAISGTRMAVLEGLAAEMGNNVHPVAANLSEAEAAVKLVDEASQTMGGLDILVPNAGITRDTLAMRMSDEDWQQVIDVNLTSNFRLIRTAIKGMMKQRWGRVISITSVVGTMGNPGQANYAASKAGLTGMTKAIAQEVASRGVTLNCVAPGFIKTPMTDALNEQQQQRIIGSIPAGTFGTPEDVAASVVFLASEQARYITGQTLHVNGGMVMV
jgi:3-oxoacyl-[acyl-carrier protein] reductase